MKLGDEYKLYSHDSCIATTQESPHKRLSKQNCDEIFGVIDVEKLACDECHIDISAYKIIQTLESGKSKSELQLEAKVDGFKLGFNKAVALNKNKLFTEDQMWNMFYFGDSLKRKIKSGNIDNKPMGEIFYDYIKSLQQPKEIEVEIEMETKKELVNGYKNQADNVIGFIAQYEEVQVPKLDMNSCLVLRKL